LLAVGKPYQRKLLLRRRPALPAQQQVGAASVHQFKSSQESLLGCRESECTICWRMARCQDGQLMHFVLNGGACWAEQESTKQGLARNPHHGVGDLQEAGDIGAALQVRVELLRRGLGRLENVRLQREDCPLKGGGNPRGTLSKDVVARTRSAHTPHLVANRDGHQ